MATRPLTFDGFLAEQEAPKTAADRRRARSFARSVAAVEAILGSPLTLSPAKWRSIEGTLLRADRATWNAIHTQGLSAVLPPRRKPRTIKPDPEPPEES